MKQDRILNTALIEAVAKIGHTQMLVIGDAGLPIPKGVPCIDLSLVRGIPSFRDVVEAVTAEMVVEAAVYAEEANEKNPGVVELLRTVLPGAELRCVPHEAFKEETKDAMVMIRTGECSPFSNTILVGGVNF